MSDFHQKLTGRSNYQPDPTPVQPNELFVQICEIVGLNPMDTTPTEIATIKGLIEKDRLLWLYSIVPEKRHVTGFGKDCNPCTCVYAPRNAAIDMLMKNAEERSRRTIKAMDKTTCPETPRTALSANCAFTRRLSHDSK